MVLPQENMRGQRGTLRALPVIFRDVRTNYNLDLRFLVKIKKQISMIMADFVLGTHQHFSWGYKRPLFFAVCKRSLLTGYAKN